LDRENKILLMRFLERRLTDESLAEVYASLREYAIATEPHAAIADFSAAIQVEVSVDFIRQLTSAGVKYHSSSLLHHRREAVLGKPTLGLP
jgi:hypothetical protein